MVNRKMRFIWNVGGGPGEVTHPLHIQTAGDLSKDQHWYRVEAERYVVIVNSKLCIFIQQTCVEEILNYMTKEIQ